MVHYEKEQQKLFFYKKFVSFFFLVGVIVGVKEKLFPNGKNDFPGSNTFFSIIKISTESILQKI
jgi:hypothetical protein